MMFIYKTAKFAPVWTTILKIRAVFVDQTSTEHAPSYLRPSNVWLTVLMKMILTFLESRCKDLFRSVYFRCPLMKYFQVMAVCICTCLNTSKPFKLFFKEGGKSHTSSLILSYTIFFLSLIEILGSK